MTIRNLEAAFTPRSVALVGASPRPGSVSHVVMKNLRAAGFSGPIRLINPKYAEIDGEPCYPDASSLPGPVDLAVVVTPPQTVPGIVAELGASGTGAAVVITAGLGSGPGSLRQQMLDAARSHTLRVFGPNCVGLLVPTVGLNGSFAHATPLKGDLALISQSGAIITTVIDWANDRNIGFSSMVSLGDMADVDFGDLLDWFAGDVHTRAILLYVEGITHPKKFMSAARAAARVKPVVVIKSGRHAEAAKAAASHTGALAGVDEVYDAAFRRAGLLRVFDLDELFDAVETLSRVKPFRGRDLAVLTNGGGLGVLAVDRLVDLDGSLADLTPETIARLDEALPPTWSHGNPVDIIGDAPPERYAAALEALLDDEATDALLVLNCPTALSSSEEAAGAVADTVRTHVSRVWPKKPVFAAWLGGAQAELVRETFDPAGVPVFSSLTAAVRGITHLVRYSEAQNALMRTPPSLPEDFTPDVDAARQVVAEALAAGREWLKAPEVARLMSAYQIPIATAEPVAGPEEARQVAERVIAEHGACAIKIFSPDIQHKTDVGGVRLDLTSPEAAEQAAREIIASARKARPDARIEGVTVEPMIHRPGARELIIGLIDDQIFGPVVLFGQGGTAVEVIRDKALMLPPLDLHLADQLMRRTRINRLLQAFRSEPEADRGAVALALVKIAQMAADVPEVRELDINPLLADDKGIVSVDARVRVAAEPEKDTHGVNPRFAIRPYPAEWERTLVTKGGDPIFVRPVRPEDEALYDDFFARVEPQDLRLRFFTPKPDLSHRFLARLTQIDYARAMAFVALEPQTGELLGVVRIHSDPDHEKAEYAIMVRSDLKGRGIGWALMELIIEYARADGLRQIHGEVLRGNPMMLQMCRQLGFAEVQSEGDPAVVTVTLSLR
ncbi:bifunctional acetate--CoA ligase family protein/GNAT family N-acetyltransferase [Microbaculum marinum]|uniref:Bifunctional acetate--CoA ligase family protein/GNAT family N-acetyltransferase n=1 Tax=Microbaculum marinum TaxID=1764581 RepID=A0AAW9RSV2_9HYPH